MKESLGKNLNTADRYSINNKEYKIYRLPSEVCDDTFYSFQEALQQKKIIEREVLEGNYDDAVTDYAWISGSEKSIEEQRDEYIALALFVECNIYTPGGIKKRTIELDDSNNAIGQDRHFKISIHGINPYEVDLERKDECLYTRGGMICSVSPWGSKGMPLVLSLCICPDGGILHRGWSWGGSLNPYLQTSDNPEDINITEEMKDTVSGLFSGRITVDGLKIAVGNTVQKIAPVNLKKEEELTGEKIYLAQIF